MATYSYTCPTCQIVKDVAYPITESPIIVCEACNTEMKKIFSAPQVTFKGGGWGKDAR